MKILKFAVKVVLIGTFIIAMSPPTLVQGATGPEIDIDPDPVLFPHTEAGSTRSLTVTLSRWFKGSTKINSVSSFYSEEFSIENDNCSGQTITRWESCTFDVYFQPQGQKHFQTLLKIRYNNGSVRWVYAQGYGFVPPLEPSTNQVDFSIVPIDSTATRVVTLTNNALVPITIESLSTDSPFTASDECVTTIPAGGACNMEIYFTPTEERTYTGYLTVRDQNENDLEIDLEGAGIDNEPNISLSTNAIDFGSQTIGTSSDPSPVKIINTGQADLYVRSIEPSSGVFTVDDEDCVDKNITPASECTFYVVFSPEDELDYEETIEIANNVPLKDPQTVAVNGVGKLPGKPAVDLSIIRYDFGDIYVGEQSSEYPVTFVNVGEADLVVTNITASDGFGVDIGSCAGTYAPSASCTFQIYFAPTEAKDYNEGSITLVDNASSPGEVTDYGIGKEHDGPALDLSEGSHSFGAQTVGTISAPYSFTLTSVGDLPVTITGITASGDFTVSGDCSKTLSPESSCVIFSTFAPTGSGERTGEISITDNTSSSPQTIALSGTGNAIPGPSVNISPETLDFGPQTIGTIGETLLVTLKNVGGSLLTIDTVEITGDQFSQENDCVGSLEAQERCSIIVTFAPTDLGEQTSEISISDNASGSPHKIDLMGRGTEVLTPDASLSSTSLDFGDQQFDTSATKTLTITNSGTSDLSIELTVIEGRDPEQFTKNDNCRGRTIEPETSCTIDVTFYPTEAAEYAARLSIADNASGSPQEVILEGNGTYPSSGGGCSLIRR